MTKPDLTDGTLHDQLTDNNKSAFGRYKDLVLGSNSIWYLIKFELIMLLCSWVPGALGLVLRKFFYPTILGSVGHNVVFGAGVSIRHGLKITIGNNVFIEDGVMLDAKGSSNAGIVIGADTIITRNCVLACKNGDIEVGNHCTFGINTLIHAAEGSDVEIGNDVLIGACCYFIGGGQYATDDLELPFKEQGFESQGGIKVANNVWFGSNVQIIDGVTIGFGSIIGASTVVNKNIADLEVVAGVPMKVLKTRQ